MERTDKQLDNLEQLTHDIEFAQVERQVLDGLKSGNEVKYIKSFLFICCGRVGFGTEMRKIVNNAPLQYRIGQKQASYQSSGDFRSH